MPCPAYVFSAHTKPALQLRREMLPGSEPERHHMPNTINNMRVPVLDAARKPLTPTSPANARKLLDSGKARPYWSKLGIFCIILQYEVKTETVQQMVCGIDPGSKFEGWSVVSKNGTIINGMFEVPVVGKGKNSVHFVRPKLKERSTMRRARRHRNCWRREARFKNRLRGKQRIPPSTRHRWDAKLQILIQLLKIVPITDVVVEDIKAKTMEHKRRYNKNFSPLEVGKRWFYQQIETLGVKLHIIRGYETANLRTKYGLSKADDKGERSFNSHAVDAWVMSADIVGATEPTWTGLYYWNRTTPIKRRKLHKLEPGKGGIRTRVGGPIVVPGFYKKQLVCHPKRGLGIVSGSRVQDGKYLQITIDDIKRNGKHVGENISVRGITKLTTMRYLTNIIKPTIVSKRVINQTKLFEFL